MWDVRCSRVKQEQRSGTEKGVSHLQMCVQCKTHSLNNTQRSFFTLPIPIKSNSILPLLWFKKQSLKTLKTRKSPSKTYMSSNNKKLLLNFIVFFSMKRSGVVVESLFCGVLFVCLCLLLPIHLCQEFCYP